MADQEEQPPTASSRPRLTTANPAMLERARGLASGSGRASQSTRDHKDQKDHKPAAAGAGAALRLTQGGRITKARQGQRPSSMSSIQSSGLPGAPSSRVQGGATTRASSNSSYYANAHANANASSTPASTRSPIHSPPINTRRLPPSSAHASATGAPSSSSSSSLLPPLSSSSPQQLPQSLPTPATSAASSATTTPPTASSRSDESSSDPSDPHAHSYFTRSASSSSAASATTASVSGDKSLHRTSSWKQQQQQPHPDAMAVDNDAPVLTFWGPDPVPLPSRFTRIKRNLIAGHEAALEASWARLIRALRDEMDHIEGLGPHLIPSIEFADMDNPAQATRFGRDLRRYGVGVVRRAVPKTDADDMVKATVDYLDSRRINNPTPLKQDPTCYDYYWTPAQVRSRAHPSVLRTQRFMMGLWETTPDDRLATRLPIAYVDRIRIHGANSEPRIPNPVDHAATNGTSNGGGADTGEISESLEHHQSPPQSADDWINALQSSAGIIAQVDNGSLERWEPDGYGHAGTYSRVFHGDWESHDPWECASRVSSTMDLYNGYGACTIFRMFQGVLALSTIEPGMIRLLPSPKLATAYYLLRPFFSPKTPAPNVRSGPEWEAYLDPSNWHLERNPDTIIHGAVPGHAQRITERWHPHLHLRGSMITLPTLQPGDYILWHPDLPYHISSSNPGLQTPHRNQEPVSMLVYIPAAPLTQTNALYLARQRKSFQRGHPGPDFDSSGRGMLVEDPATMPGEKDIAEVGGPAGLQAMGLAPWEVSGTRSATPPGDKEKDKAKTKTNAKSKADAADETKSVSSASSSSRAEAEVVRLSNIILFPDKSMMGYSV
ncbi:hypothetical protein ACO1O0_005860 [Amphichorda felina]